MAADEAKGGPPPAATWHERAALVLPTEHFTLQSARSATIADASGRANLFLGAVSAALVALGLVAGNSGLGQEFALFALAVLPVLFFLGLATFYRVTQSAAEDLLYARGINRIRHFYQEFAPEVAPYLVLSANDDDAGVLGNMAIAPSRWQALLTTGGTVGVVASAVAGAFVGLAAGVVGAPEGWGVGVGLVVFLGSTAAFYRAERALFARVDWPSPRFPSPADIEEAARRSAAAR